MILRETSLSAPVCATIAKYLFLDYFTNPFLPDMLARDAGIFNHGLENCLSVLQNFRFWTTFWPFDAFPANWLSFTCRSAHYFYSLNSPQQCACPNSAFYELFLRWCWFRKGIQKHDLFYSRIYHLFSRIPVSAESIHRCFSYRIQENEDARIPWKSHFSTSKKVKFQQKRAHFWRGFEKSFRNQHHFWKCHDSCSFYLTPVGARSAKLISDNFLRFDSDVDASTPVARCWRATSRLINYYSGVRTPPCCSNTLPSPNAKHLSSVWDKLRDAAVRANPRGGEELPSDSSKEESEG